VTTYRFEIVRRATGRYSWRLVGVKDGRRRVLARAHRDWRSLTKVEDVVAALQAAPVDDVSGTIEDRFPLPATSFGFVSGVLPLIVEEPPSEFGLASRQPAFQPSLVDEQLAQRSAPAPARAAKRGKRTT
jgi:hypothetical protein